MKALLMTLAGGLLAFSIDAADLTGHWVAEQRAPNGPVRETSVWIKAARNAFTGYLWNERQGNQPIVDGKLEGNQLSFVVVADNFGEERRQQYTATLTADGLVLHPPPFVGRGAGRGGRGVQPDLIAKRVSSEDPPPMPLKISLGAAPRVEPNGLAKSPPMGWNSWNKFRNQVSDPLVRETADAMVRSGMRDAGYVYLNIDDTWEAERDAQGNIRANDRFPDMKALIAYVHGKGLNLESIHRPDRRPAPDTRVASSTRNRMRRLTPVGESIISSTTGAAPARCINRRRCPRCTPKWAKRSFPRDVRSCSVCVNTAR